MFFLHNFCIFLKMLISCSFSIVGFQLLLLSHITHSFVLLTANVEDVKRIARKFVSDSLAEKIADFITRATQTFTQNGKILEENENADIQESSQVSAENRMYNGKEPKSKEEIAPGKVPKKTSMEKNRHVLDAGTTQKPKKEPKPLHGKSRYIIQTENKAPLPTDKALSEINEENKYNNMKQSIQLLEDKLLNTPDDKKKARKQKKKVKGRAYKLLSGIASNEDDGAKSRDSRGTKEDDRFFNARAMDEKQLLSLPTEKNEEQIDKEPTDFETKDDTNPEMIPTNQPLHLTGKDEFHNDENKIIIDRFQKVVRSEPWSLVGETVNKGENWWEREFPAQDHEGNIPGKSWF